mgnify:CR=1 FL=1|jgi:hypothetical protein
MLGSVNVKNTEHERLKMRAVFFRGTSISKSLQISSFRSTRFYFVPHRQI